MRHPSDSRKAIGIELIGFLSAAVALAISFSTDSTSLFRQLPDQAMANARGTNPQVRKKFVRNCTDEAVLAAQNAGVPAVAANDCTDNKDAICIQCRIGVSLFELIPMTNPPAPAADPNKASHPTCGTQTGSNTGISGTCEPSPDGTKMLCLNQVAYECLPVNDWGAQ